MFFKDYFKSIADKLDSNFRGYSSISRNPADKGELCELFLKEFLIDALGDSFKIFRGGHIFNSNGDYSKQIDIIINSKRTIKLFGDKGIFPTESVYGCVSVTATLSKEKLRQCCEEFKSIPKNHFYFYSEPFLNDDFVLKTIAVWQNLAPYKCIFAFKGRIEESWIEEILEIARDSNNPHNVIPDLIVVNKFGMIEKEYDEQMNTKLNFIPFDQYPYYGLPFSRMLFNLNNLANEEIFIRPDMGKYFNKDL